MSVSHTSLNFIDGKKDLKITEKKNSKKQTHLYLNGKGKREIPVMNKFTNLKVCYLHNNRISQIKNFEGLQYLTHLYLQWNNILKIENLNYLTKLQKLYLSNNKIIRLENIENLVDLEELYLEGQKIDQEFTFDTKCLKSISEKLSVLNISRLGLRSIEPLVELKNLKILFASGNDFENAGVLGRCLGEIISLKKTDIYGCPAQKDFHYRDKIIAASNLDCLDGKIITASTRNFIQGLLKSQSITKSSISSLTIPLTQRFSLSKKGQKKKLYKSTTPGINLVRELGIHQG